MIGRLMAALRVAGLAEDTIVILTSDHGEMLGERGLWYKMSFFEGASPRAARHRQPGRFEPRRVGATSRSSISCRRWSSFRAATAIARLDVDGRSLAPHLRGGGRMTKRSANIWPKGRSRRS